MRKTIAIVSLAIAWPAFAQHQQHSQYAGMEQRDIKALSTQLMEELREGRGMGASLPAELNGVPGPLHVLQLQDQLKLTVEQRAALEQIVATMKASARRLGNDVISAERQLDRAFRDDKASEEEVRALSSRIGALNADLRTTHLVAHLQTRQVLSAEQVQAYNDARGYSTSTRGSHKH